MPLEKGPQNVLWHGTLAWRHVEAEITVHQYATGDTWQNGRMTQDNFRAHLALICDLFELKSCSHCAQVALKHLDFC